MKAKTITQQANELFVADPALTLEQNQKKFRALYYRLWRTANPEKVAKISRDFWERKMKKMLSKAN